MRKLLLLLHLLPASIAFAQKAKQAVETLYSKYPQEKAILSFSKNEYLAGETIFFKAYVLTGYEPSEISTNLYVELLDKQKQVVKKEMVPLWRGSGNGGIVLPASLAEDVYYVRAYTQYMLNLDEAFQFIRPINIYNAASFNKLEKKPVQWSAKAFAEAGSLLDDVPAAVAIRLFSTGSLPEKWEGNIYEKGPGSLVAAIDILTNEVGIVYFIPSADKQYIARIKDNNGTMQTIDLPNVVRSGISMQLKVFTDKIAYSINTANIPSGLAGYKLIGTMQDEVVFVATVAKSAGMVNGTVDIKNLPSGILRLTLFDEKETPLNERLCFIHQQLKLVSPGFTTDTLSFQPKAVNSWKVSVDSISWPTYSVQVMDGDYLFSNNFLGDVYLTSDLLSPILQPQWYLTDVNDQKKAALDALLITEKWERFKWNDIMNGRFPKHQYSPDRYLSYKAYVHKGKKLQPLRDINLLFKGKDSPPRIIQVRTDSSGSFQMTDVVFVDTIKVYFQANNRKFLERDVQIDFELQNKFSAYKGSLPLPGFELRPRKPSDSLPEPIRWAAKQKTNELVMNEKAKMMEEVVIRTTVKNATEELDKKLSSDLFSSTNAMIFDFINQDQTSAISYSNILEWLQGRVPGFSINNSDGVAIPLLRGEQIQVFLDEMPVEPDMINGLSAENIAMVKLIRGVFAGGRGSGAVAIYTKRGGMTSKTSLPSLPNNFLTGYQKQPEFFSPDYAGGVSANMPDERQILFRSTMSYPNEMRLTAPVRFYTNDRAKKFRLLITGFTNDGRLVYLDRLLQQGE